MGSSLTAPARPATGCRADVAPGGWLANLALAAGSVFVSLLLAEAALHLAGYTPQHSAKTARVATPRRNLMLDCYPDDEAGGRFDVDLRDPATLARYRAAGVQRLDGVAVRAPLCVEYRYNSLHFRDREFGSLPEGARRVVVLGDSFTEGQGVREHDTYPRRLEELLRRAGHSVEVFNCGRRATDFPQLMDVFEQALALEPDVLVYGMVLNDGERSPAFEARQSYLNDWITDQEQMTGEPAERGPRLLEFVRSRVQSWRVGRESTRWYLEMYGEQNRDGWRATREHLREMDARVRQHGGRLLVALWPLLVGLEGDYPFAGVHATLGEFFREAGIRHHDLLQDLRGRASASLWVHRVDHHPNEEGHRIAAEALAPVVADLVALPPPAGPGTRH